MASPRSLVRLKKIREIEEEQHRLALEAALEQLRLLEAEREAGRLRERDGRRLTESGIRHDRLEDRIIGLTESANSRQMVEATEPRIVECASQTIALRNVLLDKRVKRRQAETLIEEASAKEIAEAARRSQTEQDDWFGSRRFRSAAQQARRDGQPVNRSPELQEEKPLLEAAGAIAPRSDS